MVQFVQNALAKQSFLRKKNSGISQESGFLILSDSQDDGLCLELTILEDEPWTFCQEKGTGQVIYLFFHLDLVWDLCLIEGATFRKEHSSLLCALKVYHSEGSQWIEAYTAKHFWDEGKSIFCLTFLVTFEDKSLNNLLLLSLPSFSGYVFIYYRKLGVGLYTVLSWKS